MVNFTVHGIGRPQRALDPGEDERWITVEQFETLLDVVARCPETRLTFDDGNVSDVEVALPRLVQRGLRAEFFPLAGRVGSRGFVDRAGLRRLIAAGMDVGSHGWDRFGTRRFEERVLRRELDAAPRLLGELSGRAVCRYSLSGRRVDRRVLGRLRAAGATRVYAGRGPGGPGGPGGAWLQHRVEVHRELDRKWAEGVLAGRDPRRWSGRLTGLLAF
ncbi:polysaccharide deacetylase family protein [Amycolatopsis rhabdoformis]|uniref:Polysaccharide deacetylase family protein n=1 Tax=Amycolatopsis rhabdoformis TaxID=1448059 RepID=A0ABZ1I3M6_9PSEU|nr:polysaccharide deacetylase family protein [Amycolatopsis rhabdoformis]WSE29009.1 polysaccharide deacetylase family protein [Amycolatopsis rhabdoformis]